MANIPLYLITPWNVGAPMPATPVATWTKPETGETMTEYANSSGVFPSGLSISPPQVLVSDFSGTLVPGSSLELYTGPGSNPILTYGAFTLSYPDTVEFDGFSISDIKVPKRLVVGGSTVNNGYVGGGLAPVTIAWGSSRNIDSKNDEPTTNNRPYVRTHPDEGDETGFYNRFPRDLKFGGFPTAPATFRLGGSRYWQPLAPGLNGHAHFEWSDGSIEIKSGFSSTSLGVNTGVSQFSHVFEPAAPAPTRVQLVNQYGQRSQWKRLRIEPWAAFTVDEGWELDASESFDLDGTIETYKWFFYGSPGILTSYLGFSGLRTSDIFEGSAEDYRVFSIREADASKYGSASGVLLSVTDNEGYVHYTTRNLVEGDHISAMADHDGVGYAAVKESDALMVKQYTSGKASEVIRATLPGFDSPSLYQLSDSTRFYLSARDTATGEYAFFYSDDHCKTFAEVS